MCSSTSTRNEEGYLLAGLVAAVAILMIFSTVAFQAWDDVVRRDKEAEMMFRAQEIVRAISRYRLDQNGAGPVAFEQLLQPGTRGQYYLRHDYKDPLIKDGKWGLLHSRPDGGIVDPNAPEAPLEENRAAAASMHQVEGGIMHLVGSEQQGLPIAGVKSLCTDKPFRVYNGYHEYSAWHFTYLDLATGFTTVPATPGSRPTGGQLPPAFAPPRPQVPGKEGKDRKPPDPGGGPPRPFPSRGGGSDKDD